MTWLELTALIAALVAVGLVVLVLALCRAAKLGDEIAERCNRAWLAGPGRNSGIAPPRTGSFGGTGHDCPDEPEL
jgi:hypothetical protein